MLEEKSGPETYFCLKAAEVDFVGSWLCHFILSYFFFTQHRTNHHVLRNTRKMRGHQRVACGTEWVVIYPKVRSWNPKIDFLFESLGWARAEKPVTESGSPDRSHLAGRHVLIALCWNRQAGDDVFACLCLLAKHLKNSQTSWMYAGVESLSSRTW